MLRTGRVVDIRNGKLQVCFERPEACAHCGACAGPKEHTLAEIEGDAPLGAWVEVDLPQGQVLKASLLAYVLPLALLLAGVTCGALLGSEIAGAAVGIAAMLLAFLILRAYEKKLKKQTEWQPKIVRVLEDGTEGNENGSQADEG